MRAPDKSDALSLLTVLYMMLFGLPLPMKQSIFVIMIIATITTAATLPSLVTGSLNPVMAQGQNMTAGNMTAGNMTETESLTTAGETGLRGSDYARSPPTVEED